MKILVGFFLILACNACSSIGHNESGDRKIASAEMAETFPKSLYVFNFDQAYPSGRNLQMYGGPNYRPSTQSLSCRALSTNIYDQHDPNTGFAIAEIKDNYLKNCTYDIIPLIDVKIRTESAKRASELLSQVLDDPSESEKFFEILVNNPVFIQKLTDKINKK